MTTSTLTLTDFLLARYDKDAEHIRFFGQPARHCASLADVEAKRRVVALHELTKETTIGLLCVTCYSTAYERWSSTKAMRDVGVEKPCPTLRALALPYADHPDYRDEWRL